MKPIIQISAFYPPHLGGQENAVADLAAALAKQHHVTVLTSDQGSHSGVEYQSNLTIHRLRSWLFGQAPIMPAFAGRLWRLLRQPSVVHLHVGQAFTPEMTWLVCRLRRQPYIVHMHIELTASGPVGWLLPIYKKLLLGPALRGAAAVLVLNDQNRQIVAQRYGYRGPIHKVSNGIAEAYFELRRRPAPPSPLRLLFVGRLTPQKNLPAILEALTQLSLPLQLDIIGDGECRPQIERLIKQHHLSHVKLHGRLERDQVLPYYARSHALLLPSLNEAQPLVLLEAMAARLPIIGSQAIGVAEHIRGVGIIGGTSAPAIAKSISRFAAKIDKMGPQVERGFQRASARRLTNLVQIYQAIYESL